MLDIQLATVTMMSSVQMVEILKMQRGRQSATEETVQLILNKPKSSRKFLQMQTINGSTIKMGVDTADDDTLCPVATWRRSGEPEFHQSDDIPFSASEEQLDLVGVAKVTATINGEEATAILRGQQSNSIVAGKSLAGKVPIGLASPTCKICGQRLLLSKVVWQWQRRFNIAY